MKSVILDIKEEKIALRRIYNLVSFGTLNLLYHLFNKLIDKMWFREMLVHPLLAVHEQTGQPLHILSQAQHAGVGWRLHICDF